MIRVGAYTPMIRNARAQQVKARREADFKPPALVDIQAVMAGSNPRTVADLQALVLDALDRVQARIQGDDLGSVSMFYEAGEPLEENDCRDRLGILLKAELAENRDIIPERAAPGHTRADMAITLGSLHLPIEIKGQWHDKLWSAVDDQLDAQYTIDWRAQGAGVYLVLWFGPTAPARCKLRGPPRPMKRPRTPDDLCAMLTNLVPEQRRGDVSVVVLDVSGPIAKVNATSARKVAIEGEIR